MQNDAAKPIGPRSRRALTIIWCAFLAASVATMLFFAFVDPAPVVALLRPTAVIPDPTTLYSLGFLFFFAVCGLASALTAWLLSP